jgi:hypothetical protein
MNYRFKLSYDEALLVLAVIDKTLQKPCMEVQMRKALKDLFNKINGALGVNGVPPLH